MPHGLDNPALVLALAMIFGVFAQGVARHARVPGIVVLLLTGVLLGPDVANLIRPGSMGIAMSGVVGFAVAIILFEGGLSLNIKHLRSQAKPIRRLVTIGAIITAVGGMLAAKIVMGWGWQISILFGTLVIVTGPTVITPLLRRIKVKDHLEVILEAEGIFIDGVGATIAVVALEVVLAPSGAVWTGISGVIGRIAIGSGIGLGGGVVLVLLLRWRRVVPEGLENILGMAAAVALFEGSNAFVAESGIIAVIVAGMIVGNTRSHAFEDLKDFQEQLTTLLIATLFVLLAADVRMADVQALGGRGVITVLLLMFLVRPATVFGSMHGTSLSRNDKLFISWLGPRGIVAAAVASLFATDLLLHGAAGGREMRALVFLVIAMTVTIQGLSGGLVAGLLKVKRPSDDGYLILGANELAMALGDALRSHGQKVIFIDSNPEHCAMVEHAGFEAFCGNGLEEKTLGHAHAASRIACLGMTPREQANYLFAQKVRKWYRGPGLYVALETEASGVTEGMVRAADFNVLFGAECQLDNWVHRMHMGEAVVRRWRLSSMEMLSDTDVRRSPNQWALPMVVFRNGRAILVDQRYEAKLEDVLVAAVIDERRPVIEQWFDDNGWTLEADNPRPRAQRRARDS